MKHQFFQLRNIRIVNISVGSLSRRDMTENSVLVRGVDAAWDDGLVVVVVTMASGEGELLGMPEIISRGFIYVKDNDELITDAKKVVIDVIERQHNLSGGDWTNLKNQMRTSLNKYFYEKTKRSPMILPIVVEI